MIQFNKKIVGLGCLLMAVTIGIGAFAAHGLEKLVSAEAIDSFETGVRYQMYHSLAIILLGILYQNRPRLIRFTVAVFLIGILFFSVSIYLLALREVIGEWVTFLGPVTPLGGLLLIFGWVRLGLGLLTKNRG